MAIWKDLPGTLLREETLELLNRIVLNISVFSWGLFKVSWERRKAALVTIGQGKCIISYITNCQLSVTNHAGTGTSAEIKEDLICCRLAWRLCMNFFAALISLVELDLVL